jgi:large subunit ribosomal protein L28
MARIKGGAGRKITGVTDRWFRPNLQTIRAVIDGVPQRIRICAKCLKTGRIQKYVPMRTRVMESSRAT